MKGNTPDFMLEHFIIHILVYSGCPPTGGVSSLTVMTTENCVVTQAKNTAHRKEPVTSSKEPYKMHNRL